jgi:hypothetical protein
MLSRKIDFRRRILSRGEPRLVGAVTGREPVKGEPQAHLLGWAVSAAIAAILIAVIVLSVSGSPPPTAK